MTVRTPTYLKARFENNDVPQQADYGDIFDSFLPISATGKQTLDISLNISGDFTASGDIYGANLYAASAGYFNQVNAQAVSASIINANRLNANLVSASGGEFNVINAQKVSASAATLRFMTQSVVSSIAATGTVTASAAVVSAALNVLLAVTSGSNECVILKRSRPGSVQRIINGTSVSAKVFPTSAAKFNNQSNGAPYDIPNNRTLEIYHITSAQYWTATHTR